MRRCNCYPDSSAADAARRLTALKPTYVGRRVEQARRKLGPANANASAEWLLLRAADCTASAGAGYGR